MRKEIMYLEQKVDGLRGDGHIGRVGFSKTGKTLFYADRTLRNTKGGPLEANFIDEETWEDFWVCVPREDGCDAHFAGVIQIDEDVREEYWADIRKQPESSANTTYKSPGKTKAEIAAMAATAATKTNG